MTSTCHRLADLDVSHCPKISDVGIIVLGGTCTALRRLNVAGCDKLGDAALNDLHCPDLSHLDASGCTLLTDAAVPAILRNAPRLATLRLAKCTGLGDDALRALVDLGAGLVDLDLRDCGLREMPPDIGDRLSKLERCRLSGNRFQTLAPSFTKVRCRTDDDLDLDDNPWTRPPADVVAKGIDAVHEYFEGLLGVADLEQDRYPAVGYPGGEFERYRFKANGRNVPVPPQRSPTSPRRVPF